MEKQLNVKNIFLRADTESGQLSSLCGNHLIRHGGLVRMGLETLRFQSHPYRCPCCKIEFSACLPSAESDDKLDTTKPLWHLDLEHYERLVGTHGIPEEDRPCTCPQCCLNERKPHRHSHFWREVFTPSHHARIPIFRFRCPVCGYVHSIIPAFLEPYQQMALDLQEELMDAIENGATQEAVAAATDFLSDEGSRTDRTIRRLYQKWQHRLHQLQEGLWSWLLSHVPHLTLPRSSSLWISFQSCWKVIRHRISAFKRIRFLHGLNRLCLSLTVTEHR